LIGLVTLSSEASLVGTMTSGGTDVIEMPSITPPTSAVAVVVVAGGSLAEVAIVGIVVVATVEGGVRRVTVGVVDAGGSGTEGGATDPAAPGAHAARSTTAARTTFALTSQPPVEKVPQPTAAPVTPSWTSQEAPPLAEPARQAGGTISRNAATSRPS
jgi:hypothetical protein